MVTSVAHKGSTGKGVTSVVAHKKITGVSSSQRGHVIAHKGTTSEAHKGITLVAHEGITSVVHTKGSRQ